MPREPTLYAASPRRRRATARDAALASARRANRVLIGGALAVGAGLSALTAHAFHAHATAAVRPASRSDTTRQATGATLVRRAPIHHHHAALRAPGSAPAAPASSTPAPAPSAPAPAPAPAPTTGGS